MTAQPDYISSLPVICVGNFTAGGTGKTPLTIHIAARLKVLGARPAILTRGYGGTVSGPYDVTPETDKAERVGDEPLLLANAAPTVVCRDRVMGAKHIERTNATAIIMDDGMQNPTLGKNLTIAVIDGARGLGNGWAIPSGPLRVSLRRQFEHVDAILINGESSEQTREKLASMRISVPVINGTLAPATNKIELSKRAVVAFSGIGNPSRFHKTLEDCGAQIRDRFDFPDHHAFTDPEAEKILFAAKREEAVIVTTEKDRVRLLGAKQQSARLKLLERSLALPVAFRFQGSDAARLDAMLDMVLRQHGAG